jgi:putative membrane protein insertion efficiency factor
MPKIAIKIMVFLIDTYQKLLSPDKGLVKKLGISRGQKCVFIPTCSEYSKEAFTKYGFFKGFFLSIKRIVRCHPWQKHRIDFLK